MKQYPGIYLKSEPVEERYTGMLFFGANYLQFQSAAMSYTIPFQDMDIDAGNGRSRFIFFRNKQIPAICVYTEVRAILQEDWMRENKQVMGLVKKSRSHRRIVMTLLASFLLLIALMLFALFAFRNELVRAIANKIPPKWEKEAGEQMFNNIKALQTLLGNDSLQNILEQNTGPLTAQCSSLPYALHFHIINDSTMNAYVLPGGQIIINSGLINKAASWEELLGVLSHEIAHVTLKHHARGIVQQVGIQTILYWWLGGGNDAGAAVGKLGGELADLAYSREFEQEADDEGLVMLRHAHIDPEGMISFFQKIQQEETSNKLNQGNELTFLSSHPSTPERIERLQQKLKGMAFESEPLPGWKEFQLAIRQTLAEW